MPSSRCQGIFRVYIRAHQNRPSIGINRKNITLHSYIIVTDEECRRGVRGWCEEVEARLEEWITDEGNGLDLDKNTPHDITISKILVPQATERYIPFPANARGSRHIFNPIEDTDYVIHCCWKTAGSWKMPEKVVGTG